MGAAPPRGRTRLHRPVFEPLASKAGRARVRTHAPSYFRPSSFTSAVIAWIRGDWL